MKRRIIDGNIGKRDYEGLGIIFFSGTNKEAQEGKKDGILAGGLKNVDDRHDENWG